MNQTNLYIPLIKYLFLQFLFQKKGDSFNYNNYQLPKLKSDILILFNKKFFKIYIKGLLENKFFKIK